MIRQRVKFTDVHISKYKPYSGRVVSTVAFSYYDPDGGLHHGAGVLLSDFLACMGLGLQGGERLMITAEVVGDRCFRDHFHYCQCNLCEHAKEQKRATKEKRPAQAAVPKSDRRRKGHSAKSPVKTRSRPASSR